MKKLNKKGQVTLFVIIGIILLASVGTILIITNSNSSTSKQQDTITKTETQYQPIVNYVDQCIDSIGTKIIKQIGVHGGYLDPQKTIEVNPKKPYDSQGVELTNSPTNIIPYWIYSKERSDQNTEAIPTISIPDLNTIATNYGAEIDKELPSCINNLEALNFTGFTFKIKNKPQTKVVFADKDITLKTTLPIEITSPDGTKKEITTFEKTIGIPFKKYYLIAKVIALQEAKYTYLENLLITMISYYGNAGTSNSIPPFYTVQEGFSFISWTQPEVKNRLQTLLQENIPLLRVQGTKNELPLTSLTKEKNLSEQEINYFKMLNMPILPVSFPNISIDFEYLQWPIYLQVYPHEGLLIKPKSENADVDRWYKAQEQYYQFYYDISYPVVVELREQNLTAGNKFTFLFAMEGNIRKNHNWRDYANNSGPINWDPRTSVQATIKGQSDEVTDLLTNKTYTVPAVVQKLFNDKKQFVSQPLKLETINAITGEPIDKVQIQIGIGTYARAIIGETHEENGKATFEGKGPIVRNGYITISKENYLPYSNYINLSMGQQELDLGKIKLIPLTKKNITVKVWDLKKITIPFKPEILKRLDAINTTKQLESFQKNISLKKEDQIIVVDKLIERNMSSNESVMITMKKISPQTHEVIQNFFANINKNHPQEELDLTTGNYELSAQLFDSAGVIIPKNSKKICHSRKECKQIPKDKQYIPYEDIEMKPALWGGVEFNSSTPWTLNDKLLYSNKTIVINVIKFPPPKTIDDINYLSELPSLTQKFLGELLPSQK